LVLAVDLPDGAVRADAALGSSAVRVSTAVTSADLAAVHVDDEQAEPDVAAAVAAVPAATSGDADAQFTVEAAEDHDLLWYDPSELDVLLAGS
jgi:hypothetical protein